MSASDASAKQHLLLALAKRRQLARWPGYSGIGDYHNGIYECDHVSPYTKCAGNVSASIMVILQDWSSHERLSGPVDQDAVLWGCTPSLPTNKTLAALLRRVFEQSLSDIYAINLFPFIKSGNLSNRIVNQDMLRAAREFCLPQIQIIRPALVIALGLQTFNALRRACEISACKNLSSAISAPFVFKTSRIWCQAHTGMLGQNTRNRRNKSQTLQDWQHMRNFLVEPVV